jgi:hypothetical protein
MMRFTVDALRQRGLETDRIFVSMENHDAPRHFDEHGITVDQVPLETTIGGTASPVRPVALII